MLWSSGLHITPTCDKRTVGRTDTRRQLITALASVERVKKQDDYSGGQRSVFLWHLCQQLCEQLFYRVCLLPGTVTVRSSCVSKHCSRSAIITFRVRRSRGEMCIGHARLCVSLSLRRRIATLLHGPWCNLGEWQGMLSSHALLGGFAIGARV